jgi:hypothetical protein
VRFKYKCNVCGATGWARGWSEPDVNAAGLCDDNPMEDACEHIKAGGDYELVDQEYEEYEDNVI